MTEIHDSETPAPARHCGECKEFLHEDADGIGFCDEYTAWKHCGDMACGLFKAGNDEKNCKETKQQEQ